MSRSDRRQTWTWRRPLAAPVRAPVTLSILAFAFLILSVSLGGPTRNYPKQVPLFDRLIMLFGPSASAKVDIKEPAATITLKFYRVWDETENEGRYLTVTTSRGEVTRAICGFDWLHYSETKIYLTPDRKVAVLGPNSCEYLVSTDPLGMIEAHNLVSAGAIYLGTFGLVKHSARPDMFELQFAPAGEATEKRGE